MRSIAIGQEYNCPLDYLLKHKELLETNLYTSGGIYTRLWLSSKTNMIGPKATVFQWQSHSNEKETQNTAELTYSSEYNAYKVTRLQFGKRIYSPKEDAEEIKLI